MAELRNSYAHFRDLTHPTSFFARYRKAGVHPDVIRENEGDLLVLWLDCEPDPVQLRAKRRRFDFSGSEPELQIDLELVRNRRAPRGPSK